MPTTISALKWLVAVSVIYILTAFSILHAQQKYTLYLDADFSGATASSDAIRQGINTALAEVDYQLQGIQFELVLKNHRANSLRSKRNLEAFLADEQALLVFSGLHSPPLLANKSYINENKILLLDPWAAAGPITRSNSKQNWIFRLSIDDSNAGIFISQQALKQGFKKPYLLLEDTGWGRSNERTMKKALESRGLQAVDTVWFDWDIGKNGTRVILNDLFSKGVDVIFFVGNAPEGITFFKSMSDRAEGSRIPIRSHWGITGGDIFEVLGPEILVDDIDLKFIQTSFSFLEPLQSDFSKDVFYRASSMFDKIKSPVDITAPCGFIHGYDITRLLISAINSVSLTGNIAKDRELVRLALENIKTPVQGLIKEYKNPFSAYSKDNLSAHEALGTSDLRMATYTEDGGIRVFNEK